MIFPSLFFFLKKGALSVLFATLCFPVFPADCFPELPLFVFVCLFFGAGVSYVFFSRSSFLVFERLAVSFSLAKMVYLAPVCSFLGDGRL